MHTHRLRIAMLAPVSWPVPPAGYGPWEQVASNLTEQLVNRGHDVTLFAAKGSKTTARLVETTAHPFEMWPQAERDRERCLDPETGLLEGPPDFRALEQQHIATCIEQAAQCDFDLVHSHLHVHALVFARLIPCPLLTTLHGAAWVRAHHPVLDRYKDAPYVSLSDAERSFKPDLNYAGTVHNGIVLDRFKFQARKESHLLFAGRLSPEKGAAQAVQIAAKANRPLRMAGTIEPQYQRYFDQHIKPDIDNGNTTYLGPLSQTDLAEQYRAAAAVLFPIQWSEPFGLVVAESLACGTPVIAFRMGAMPELIRDGETGYLADTVDDAANAARHLDQIDPAACRRDAEQRFSDAAMAQGYERVYRQVLTHT